MTDLSSLWGRSNRLALLYLLVAIPAGLMFVVLLPLMQAPDETHHLYRAAQVADGHWIFPRPLAGEVPGGDIDTGLLAFATPFHEVAGHEAKKVTAGLMENARNGSWTHANAHAGFPGAAGYPPTFYVTTAGVLALSRSFDLSLLPSVYAARALNLVAALAMAFAAINLVGRGRLLLLALLLLPMTLHQFASLSQDSGLIAATVLTVALAARAAATGNRWVFGGAALCIAALATSRPPLMAFIPLLWLPMEQQAPRRIGTGLRLLATGLCTLLVAGWVVWVASLRIQMRPDVPVSTFLRLQETVLHPGALLAVLKNTFAVEQDNYWHTFVGILGTLDTPLPDTSYRAAAVAIVCGLLHTAMTPGRALLRNHLLAGAVTLGAAALMFLTFYFIWTPPGASLIEGVQGRYLLCIAPGVALAVPPVLVRFARLRPWLVAACVTASVVAISSAPGAMARRFYANAERIPIFANAATPDPSAPGYTLP